MRIIDERNIFMKTKKVVGKKLLNPKSNDSTKPSSVYFYESLSLYITPIISQLSRKWLNAYTQTK